MVKDSKNEVKTEEKQEIKKEQKIVNKALDDTDLDKVTGGMKKNNWW